MVPKVNPVEVVVTALTFEFNGGVDVLSPELDFPNEITDPEGCKGALNDAELLVVDVVFAVSGFELDKSNLNPPTFGEFVGDVGLVASDFAAGTIADGVELAEPPILN